MLSPEQIKELYAKLAAKQYLPREMRDFHAQKKVFKSFFDWFKGRCNKQRKERGSPDFFLDELDQYTWSGIHVLLMDHFLPWMALHGYRIGKWNPKCGTYDMDETIAKMEEEEMKILAAIITPDKEEKIK